MIDNPLIYHGKKILNLKVVRYFFTAITATCVDVFVYFITYNYVLLKTDLHFSKYVIGAPTASLLISFCFGLTTNFTLTRKFVFPHSSLRIRHQLFRYIAVALIALVLNYFLMNFLIKEFGWYPTLSRACAAVSVGVLSFIVHKTFSFHISNSEVAEDEIEEGAQ
ncbi:MAG TPA: hypothetical protein DCQ93_06680 [Bacteroidetes bacterium]|nr:hypothetical protein [Bacteroidota bacterium]